jgi:glutamate-ammonia-ligase adenylyltransferase
MAGSMGFIDAGLAGRVADAYRTFRQIQHRLRLIGAERARIEPEAG